MIALRIVCISANNLHFIKYITLIKSNQSFQVKLKSV